MVSNGIVRIKEKQDSKLCDTVHINYTVCVLCMCIPPASLSPFFCTLRKKSAKIEIWGGGGVE